MADEEMSDDDKLTHAEKVQRRYRYLCQAFMNLVKCKRCELPYNNGYVCPCGWDNSYEYVKGNTDGS